MTLLSPETIEELCWIASVIVYAMAWGAPAVPLCTVTGIMAWGAVFRGTTTREAFQRGWRWLVASVPIGILLWFATKDQTVPEDLLFHSPQTFEWISADPLEQFLPSAVQGEAQTYKGIEVRTLFAGFQALHLAAADVGLLRQKFLGPHFGHSHSLEIHSKLDLRLNEGHTGMKRRSGRRVSDLLGAFCLLDAMLFTYRSGTKGVVTKSRQKCPSANLDSAAPLPILICASA